jgi:cytochrome c biogenesis protein
MTPGTGITIGERDVMKRTLISYRFAVTVIAILFGASALGWILSELVPPDLLYRQDVYRARWGDTGVSLMTRLGLHDPFHTFWYRAVLALFFVALAVCIASRWRNFLLRSFRAEPPEDVERLRRYKPRWEISWQELKLKGPPSRDILDEMERRHGPGKRLDTEQIGGMADSVARYLRGRGYLVRRTVHDGEVRFSAVAGRWRHFGSFLFHLGILVITIGGMLGSFWGSMEILYGTSGDRLPLGDSPYAVQVEEFDVLRNENMEVTEYVSSVSIVDDSGNRYKTATIEVNEPLRFDGYDILQSSYYVDEGSFLWARVEYADPANPAGAAIRLEPDSVYALRGFPLTITAKRFLPDLKIGPDGPYSQSANMNNPALEVMIDGEGGAQIGWLFLYHPRFNTRFELPVQFHFADVAPIYYTGLQISTNPGSTVLLAGIAVATAGLILLAFFTYRCVKGVVDAERIVLAGMGYRWRVSFTREFERITKGLIEVIIHGSND